MCKTALVQKWPEPRNALPRGGIRTKFGAAHLVRECPRLGAGQGLLSHERCVLRTFR